MAFEAIPTLLGQAALADAVAGVAPLDLANMIVGDGNGSPTTPVETQTALVNLRATIPLQTVARDIDNPSRVNIDAVIDENTGGWTIREAGILDSDGQLLFVASVPATQKQTLAENVEDILTLGLYVVISASANITIAISESTWATQGFVLSQLESWRTHVAQPLRPYFIAVDSITEQAPAVPAPGATCVVPVSAIGVWAGQDGKLAQYRGNTGWVFAVAPIGTMVAAGAQGTLWRLLASGWRKVAATEAEHLLANSDDLFTTPLGVQKMINAKFPANAAGGLYNNGNGTLSWVPLLNIVGLASKVSVAAGDMVPVYDPVLGANRRVTAEQLAQRVSISDALHSEMFFYGGG